MICGRGWALDTRYTPTCHHTKFNRCRCRDPQNFGDSEDGHVMTLLETCFSPTCPHTKFHGFRSNRIGIGIGHEKFGDAGPAPFDVGIAGSLETSYIVVKPYGICRGCQKFGVNGVHPFMPPTFVAMSNLFVLGQTLQTQLWRSAKHFWPLTPCLWRSLKVTGTDTDWSATMTSYLVHSNCGPILYHFWDTKRYLQNSPTRYS